MGVAVYGNLSPGDLVTLNWLVIVTDWCGIVLATCAGVVLSTPMRWRYKAPLAGVLQGAAYLVINVWAF